MNYAGVRYLLEKYGPQGFAFLAVESNEFGGQGPGTDEEERQINYQLSTSYFQSWKKSGQVKKRSRPTWKSEAGRVQNECHRPIWRPSLSAHCRRGPLVIRLFQLQSGRIINETRDREPSDNWPLHRRVRYYFNLTVWAASPFHASIHCAANNS